MNLYSISTFAETDISSEEMHQILDSTNEEAIFKALSDIYNSKNAPEKYRQHLDSLYSIAKYPDYSDTTKGMAIILIGKVGLPEKQARDYLLEIANTPTPFFIQREVINSLSFWLTDQRNISVLSRMKNNYKFTYEKNDWLEEFTPIIISQVGSKDKWVSKAAVTTLGDIGSYSIDYVNQLLHIYKALFKIDEALRKEIENSITKISDDLQMRVENTNLDIETRKEAITNIGKLDIIIFSHLMSVRDQSMTSFLYNMPKTDIYLSNSLRQWSDSDLTLHTLSVLQDIIEKTNKHHIKLTGKPRYRKNFTVEVEIIKPISSRLFDENKDIRLSTIKLLSTLGKASKSAVPALEKLKKRDRSLEEEISKAIKAIK